MFTLTTHGLSFFECVFLDMRNTAMPDERAVMTYVSSYYHCFSGAQKVCSLHFELTITDALSICNVINMRSERHCVKNKLFIYLVNFSFFSFFLIIAFTIACDLHAPYSTKVNLIRIKYCIYTIRKFVIEEKYKFSFYCRQRRRLTESARY